MKIEIDLENIPALRQQRAQLARYIELIDVALGNQSDRDSTRNESNLHAAQNDDATIAFVNGILVSLPNDFTGSQVYQAAEVSNSTLSRGAIRAGLSRIVAAGSLRITEPGQGRRPTRYQKVSL